MYKRVRNELFRDVVICYKGFNVMFYLCWFTHNLHTFKSLKSAFLKTLPLEQLHSKCQGSELFKIFEYW